MGDKMFEYYQFSEHFHDKSQSTESSKITRWNDHFGAKKFTKDTIPEGQLKFLYFISYLALVCIAHFAKFFYLEAGLSVTEVGCLQCVFYLSRFIGAYSIESFEHWLVSTRRAGENVCLQNIRTIMAISLVVSTIFWVLLVIKDLHDFSTFVLLVFLGSITISSSHGFLDLIAFDMIVSSSERISYSALRFWGIVAWGFGSFAIGALIDLIHPNAIFIMFTAFNLIFLACVLSWVPAVHKRQRIYEENSITTNMCELGILNVFIFLFVFGMLNAMPEILMMHMKLEYGISYGALGVFISILAVAELGGYFMVRSFQNCFASICETCGEKSLTAMAILTLSFMAFRFYAWTQLDSYVGFFFIEFFQMFFVTIFWIIALITVKDFVPKLDQGTVNDDLESMWHFQSLACGVLVGSILYDNIGKMDTFNVCAGVSLVLIVYYFLAFLCCRRRRDNGDWSDAEAGGEKLLQPDQGRDVNEIEEGSSHESQVIEELSGSLVDRGNDNIEFED